MSKKPIKGAVKSTKSIRDTKPAEMKEKKKIITVRAIQ